MITKERLEELIEQEATVYELYIKDILQVKLEKDYFVINGGLYKSRYAFRTWWLKDLYETREDAEFVKEFGCIERTERLELPTWEEFLKLGKIYSFKSKNNQIVVLFIDGNTIYLEDENWNILREPLTKENYTLACRKAKELFLKGNAND